MNTDESCKIDYEKNEKIINPTLLQTNSNFENFKENLNDITVNYEILKRENFEDDSEKVLYPKKTYHERMQNYIQVRNRIFKDFVKEKVYKKPKRSTLRIRRFYKALKKARKLIISSVLNSSDQRFYAEVKFLNRTEYGLLDTGASISCLGDSIALEDFSQHPSFQKISSSVKTADGKLHKIIGLIEVDIEFKNKNNKIKLYIIPSIIQKLILGIDFWRSFDLAPGIISSISTETQENEDSEEKYYPLTYLQKQQLETVKKLFPNFDTQGLGRTKLIEHVIDVGDSKPIKQRSYPVSPAVEKLMFQEIERMLSLGVIEESASGWSSPMRLVVKPGKVRLCLDARKLNGATKKDAYPIQSINGIFARLPKANIITKLDLKDAYWQIGLSESSKPLTAFVVPGKPLYHFTVMPFGLTNAPATMCRLIDRLIPPDLTHCVFGYLDDICIVSENFENHLAILVRLAEKLREANLTLNLRKSSFCVTETKYLGFIIGNGGISADPDKISSILNWPIPKTRKQAKGFLGLAGFYRRFIDNFADISTPISNTTSTKTKFEWSPEANVAFEKLKTFLTTTPVLANPDFSKKFYIHCDASDYGIGAVLVQKNDAGEEQPIAYISKK